jgi:hypothetical protein
MSNQIRRALALAEASQAQGRAARAEHAVAGEVKHL